MGLTLSGRGERIFVKNGLKRSQQDGAMFHITEDILDVLCPVFKDGIIKKFTTKNQNKIYFLKYTQIHAFLIVISLGEKYKMLECSSDKPRGRFLKIHDYGSNRPLKNPQKLYYTSRLYYVKSIILSQIIFEKLDH